MELIPQVLLVRFFKGENMELFSTTKVVVVFVFCNQKTGWTVSSSSAFDIMIQIPPLGFPLQWFFGDISDTSQFAFQTLLAPRWHLSQGSPSSPENQILVLRSPALLTHQATRGSKDINKQACFDGLYGPWVIELDRT